MFGIGLPELMVIGVIAMFVFGPDRLPEFARQSGRLIRQLKRMTQSARDDIRSELGPEFSKFELTDLDPRKAIRKHITEAWNDVEETPSSKKTKPLSLDELPPYDVDAT